MSSAIGPRRGLTVRPLQPVLGDVFDPEANPLVSIGQIARKPGMPLLIVVSCVFAFAFNGINSTLSKYISEKFSVTAAQIQSCSWSAVWSPPSCKPHSCNGLLKNLARRP